MFTSSLSAFFDDLISRLSNKKFNSKPWAENKNIGKGGDGVVVYDNCFDLYGTIDITVTDIFSSYHTPTFVRRSRDLCVERVVQKLKGDNFNYKTIQDGVYTNYEEYNATLFKDIENDNDWFLTEPSKNIADYFRRVPAKRGYGGAVVISW